MIELSLAFSFQPLVWFFNRGGVFDTVTIFRNKLRIGSEEVQVLEEEPWEQAAPCSSHQVTPLAQGTLVARLNSSWGWCCGGEHL